MDLLSNSHAEPAPHEPAIISANTRADECIATLEIQSVPTLRRLFASLNKSFRLQSFDPARDPRTAAKADLIRYIVHTFSTLDASAFVWEVSQLGIDTPEPRAVRATPTPTVDAPTDELQRAALDLARILAATRGNQAQPLDVDAVRAIATECAAAAVAGIVAPLQIEIRTPTGELVAKIDRAHKSLPLLLAAAQARQAVWLYGPPGTGKTTAAEQVAQALGLKSYSTGAVDSAHALIGYTDAQGRAVMTAFRYAWTHGGVFLFDEADSSHPAAMLAINNALANGRFTFPGDTDPTQQHADCIIIVGANTKGSGGDVQHARMKMDTSTRDRFVFISWPLDLELETAIVPRADWLARVRAARAWITARDVRGACVTTRAGLQGSRLLAAGMPLDAVDAGTWGRDLTDDQIKACAATLPKLLAQVKA